MTSNADVYLNSLVKKGPEDLVLLDLTRLDSIADFFVICHGNSTRQVIAIAEYIKLDLKKQSIRPLGSEGFREGHWVILDYGGVIIHIFYKPFRQHYNLEGLWFDAKLFRISRSETENSMSFDSFDNYANFQSILID